RRNLTRDIIARVSPAAQDAISEPPPSSSWVDGALLIEIEVAIEALVGIPMARQISRDAVNRGAMVALRPIVEGLLRVFGVSPHTILQRIALIATASNRGLEFSYSRIAEHRGELIATMPTRRNVPSAIFEGLAGALSAAFENCGVVAKISTPQYLPNGK